MKCRSTRLLAVAGLAVLLAGCPGPRNGQPVKPSTQARPGTQVRPTPTPLAGSPEAILKASYARLAGGQFTKLTTYVGNRLFAYMNGAAEAYFSRGFVKLATVDVKWKATEATVEFYQVKTAANAAALLDEFDDGQGKKLAAGVRSAAWAAKELEGIFHRGVYFCRIIVIGNDQEAHDLLAALATAIDKAIEKP